MAIYDFKCSKCERIDEDVILSITHLNSELPLCCDTIMGYHITKPPSVHWVDPVIEPFRSIATKDKPIISTTKERREYMARNDLLDANDVCEPPSDAQQKQAREEMQDSIDAITPSGAIKEDLEKRGLTDIV
jgi:hypothetical protein